MTFGSQIDPEAQHARCTGVEHEKLPVRTQLDRFLGAASKLFGQGTVKLPPHAVWQRRGLSVAVHFNRLPRRIHNKAAVLTVLEVSGELLGQNRI